MKVTCPISGIRYALANPLRGHAIHPHPMLSSSITIAQLNDWYLPDWISGDLAADLTHLLGCAYLLRLPIESANLPVMSDEQLVKWSKFWTGNLESLAKLATKLDGRNKVFKRLPRLVVNSETLATLPSWLEDLQTELSISSAPISDKAKELNRESYKVSAEISARTVSQYLAPDQIDSLVLRALRASPLAKSESKALPVILADWADKVTEFPEGNRVRWQRIIQTVFNEDYINQILMSDIKVDQVKAIEEHLRLNTPAHAVGTSHSQLLMQRLDTVIPVLEDFNPMVSARKKTNEAQLVAGLFGPESERSERDNTKEVAKQTSLIGNKPMTLTERLAARMAGLNKAGN